MVGMKSMRFFFRKMYDTLFYKYDTYCALNIQDIAKIVDIKSIPLGYVSQEKPPHGERMHTMQHVDDSFDTLTADLWQDVEEAKPAAPVTPQRSRGRIARFFESLAASMALQRSTSGISCRHQRAMYSADILAQNYPHLYLRVMCG